MTQRSAGSYTTKFNQCGTVYFVEGVPGTNDTTELVVRKGSVAAGTPSSQGPQRSCTDVHVWREVEGNLTCPTKPPHELFTEQAVIDAIHRHKPLDAIDGDAPIYTDDLVAGQETNRELAMVLGDVVGERLGHDEPWRQHIPRLSVL